MSYKQKFLITITIVISILTGLAFLGYTFFTYIQDSETAIYASRDDIALLLAKKKQVADISKEYDSVKNAIPLLDEALLHKNDTLSFIILVEKLATETNVSHKVEAVVEDSTANGKGLPTALFNLNLTGRFSDVLKFIYLIENAKPYASLQSVQITTGTSGVQRPETEFSSQEITAHTSIKVYTK